MFDKEDTRLSLTGCSNRSKKLIVKALLCCTIESKFALSPSLSFLVYPEPSAGPPPPAAPFTMYRGGGGGA